MVYGDKWKPKRERRIRSIDLTKPKTPREKRIVFNEKKHLYCKAQCKDVPVQAFRQANCVTECMKKRLPRNTKLPELS